MLSKEKVEEYARKIEPLYTRDDYGQKKPTMVVVWHGQKIKMAVLE